MDIREFRLAVVNHAVFLKLKNTCSVDINQIHLLDVEECLQLMQVNLVVNA